jgi:hypothetical protein
VGDLKGAPDIHPDAFVPPPGMVEMNFLPPPGARNRMPMRVVPTDAPPSPLYQPVMVHAILDARDGTVLDAEPLQNTHSDLNQEALELLNAAAFQPTGYQQEVYINVEFHYSAGTRGGVGILHRGGPWLIKDEKVRIVDPRRPIPRPVVK